MFGNLVILPDGSLLACGGMDRHPFNHADTQWFSTSERFEPLGPLDQGVWTDMDQREIVVTFPGESGHPRSRDLREDVRHAEEEATEVHA
jgi:hypothetical protein